MLHGTERNMYYWEMLASCLHKGNYGYTQILLFYCNGTGMEYIARKWRNACSWEIPTLSIKIKLRGNCQILQLYCNGTGYEIHRYYQWQEEKEYALALDLTVVAQCIILRERG